MTTTEISNAFTLEEIPGVKKRIDEELKEQANRYTAIIFIVVVIMTGVFTILYAIK